jgi:hypothetical protein
MKDENIRKALDIAIRITTFEIECDRELVIPLGSTGRLNDHHSVHAIQQHDEHPHTRTAACSPSRSNPRSSRTRPKNTIRDPQSHRSRSRLQ